MAEQKQVMRMSRRRLLQFGMVMAAGVTSMTALQACAPAVAPTAAPTAASQATTEGGVVEGGTVTTAIGKPPVENYNPLHVTSTAQGMVVYPVFNTLFRGMDWGPDMAPDTSLTGLTPELAESIEEVEKDRVWLLHLRKDVKWHDGKPLTADDVVWTYFAMEHRDVGAGASPNYRDIKGAQALIDNGGDTLEGVQKVDDYTVRLEAEKPTPGFLTDWSRPWYVIPKHPFEGVPLDQVIFSEPFASQPIGTGPFKVKSSVAGQYVEMERNDDYFLGKPHVDKFVVRWMAPDTIDASLESGELDSAQTGSIQAYERLANLPHLMGLPQSTPFPVGVNINRSRFPEAGKLHEAVLYAVDREKINKELNGNGLFLSDYLFEHVRSGAMSEPPACLKHFTYDPDQAKAVLSDIGWDTNRHLEWTVWGPPTPTYQAIQAMLAEVGLNVDFKVVDAATVEKDVFEDRNFDMIFTNVGGFDSMALNWLYFKCDAGYAGGKGYNADGYCNPDVDAAWQAALDEADPAAQEEMFKNIACLLQEDIPFAVMWRGFQRNIYNRRVQGVFFRNNYALSVRVPYERLWIKPS